MPHASVLQHMIESTLPNLYPIGGHINDATQLRQRAYVMTLQGILKISDRRMRKGLNRCRNFESIVAGIGAKHSGCASADIAGILYEIKSVVIVMSIGIAEHCHRLAYGIFQFCPAMPHFALQFKNV